MEYAAALPAMAAAAHRFLERLQQAPNAAPPEDTSDTGLVSSCSRGHLATLKPLSSACILRECRCARKWAWQAQPLFLALQQGMYGQGNFQFRTVDVFEWLQQAGLHS